MAWKKRTEYLKEGIGRTVLDRFELENPRAVGKMNPMKKNSPLLYDEKKFENGTLWPFGWMCDVHGGGAATDRCSTGGGGSHDGWSRGGRKGRALGI